MRPRKSILDPSFRYVPSVATSVVSTWRRFGWRPTTPDERDRRRLNHAVDVVPARDLDAGMRTSVGHALKAV
jgi:hypothetical protein